MGGSSMLDRMVRAAFLDEHVYEEVEADPGAMRQVVVIVALNSLASMVGYGANLDRPEGVNVGWLFLGGMALGFLYWALWALVTYMVGATVLRSQHTHADWGQLARTTGFAQSPGILRFLGAVPLVGEVFLSAIFIWQFAAMIVAVRQALDYTSTVRAVAVVVIGQVFVLALLLAYIALPVLLARTGLRF